MPKIKPNGNSKLLFTCPHHGKRRDLDKLRVGANYPIHTCKEILGESFNIKNDIGTRQLTKSIVNNIHNLSGNKPYDEIAQYHREYIDYNRHEECAFEQSSLQAKQRYQEYHNGILQKIEEMLPQNGNDLAFLFDIHGAGRKDVKVENEHYPFEVLIGTDHENSIQALTQINPDAWWGVKGLIPLLQEKDIVVFPPDASLEEQNQVLDGGYTIQTYGSSQFQKGLVAIQIEVIHSIRRDPDRRQQLAEVMADCILQFVSPFI